MKKIGWFVRLAVIRILLGKKITLITGANWSGGHLSVKEGRRLVFMDTNFLSEEDYVYDRLSGWPKTTRADEVLHGE